MHGIFKTESKQRITGEIHADSIDSAAQQQPYHKQQMPCFRGSVYAMNEGWKVLSVGTLKSLTFSVCIKSPPDIDILE